MKKSALEIISALFHFEAKALDSHKTGAEAFSVISDMNALVYAYIQKKGGLTELEKNIHRVVHPHFQNPSASSFSSLRETTKQTMN